MVLELHMGSLMSPSWGAPRSRRSGKRRKERREGRGKVGRRGSPVKTWDGKKKKRREGKRGGKNT